MNNRQFFINNLWRWKCGLPELEPEKPVSYEQLQKTEWSVNFEQLMRNRLMVGSLRYGRIGGSNKPKYNRVESMLKRLQKFNESGNKEYLVDVANLCLLEFEECTHPNQHFESVDDGDHVTIINK